MRPAITRTLAALAVTLTVTAGVAVGSHPYINPVQQHAALAATE